MTNKPRRVAIPESYHQRAVMLWASCKLRTYPELKLLFAVPNGGLRDPVVAAKLKAEGLKPGVPDLCLPVARKGAHGLYIEMKAEGGRVSVEQKQWIADLTAQGYLAVVCVGADQAINTLTDYLK